MVKGVSVLEGVVRGLFGRAARVRLTGVRVGNNVLISFYFEGNRQGRGRRGVFRITI